MFDPTTAALIRSAPPLEGLDLGNLPKRLTEAYADIVSARIRLRGVTADIDDEALAATVSELRRIAAAHETYAALLPDRKNRVSAAFVAASAHQAISLASRGIDALSQVDIAAVSPDVCATLLFLLAEAHADAAEAAKRIVPAPEAGPIERALLLAIRNLAQGRLGAVVGADEPAIEVDGDDLGFRALDALRLLLWLRKLWPLWMSGVPLCELEMEFLERSTKLKQCRNARVFASRLVPDLAFLAGLPGRLLAARLRAAEDETPFSVVLATLSGAVREGCDSPDSLAVRIHLTRSVSRVAARKHYDAICHHIQPGNPNESFDDTLERIRNAVIIASFDDLNNLGEGG